MDIMHINKQGGDNDIPSEFYSTAIQYIPEGSAILNLGCGSRFNFEKLISRNKTVSIESCDIVGIKRLPKYIKKYYQNSVEDVLPINKKYDVVTFFELIEHVDKTDELLKNCYRLLKPGGKLIFSFPNLSSVYARAELLLGFQPHILEVSNEYANFGTGIMGHLNAPGGKTLHHIRGIVFRAMIEMLCYYKFKIIKTIGYEYRLKGVFRNFPSLAPVCIIICRKEDKI